MNCVKLFCMIFRTQNVSIPPNDILRTTRKSNPSSNNSQHDESNHFKQPDQILQSKKFVDGTGISEFILKMRKDFT